VLKLVGHTDTVGQIAWNADDTQLVSVSADLKAIIWDTINGSQIQTLSHQNLYVGFTGTVEWTLDETRILTGAFEGTPDTLFEWDIATGLIVSRKSIGAVGDLVWSPDQTQLVMGGTRVGVLSALDFSLVASYVDRQYVDHGPSILVTAVDWQPTGKYIASGNALGTVRLRDAVTGEIVHEFQASDIPETFVISRLVQTVRFNADGSLLQSITKDGTVRVWEVETGKLIEDAQLGTHVSAAAWSPYLGRIAYSELEQLPDEPRTGPQFKGSNELLVVVPSPSLEKVSRIAKTCLMDSTSQSVQARQTLSTETLTTQNLPQFVADIKSLPPDAIPPACAADLIAVAEAILAQPQ
jgi:WD40 repeat protein